MNVKVFFKYKDKDYHFLTFYPLFLKDFRYKTDIGRITHGHLSISSQFLEEITVAGVFGDYIQEEFPEITLDPKLNKKHFEVEVWSVQNSFQKFEPDDPK
jgi:hypothetical protein